MTESHRLRRGHQCQAQSELFRLHDLAFLSQPCLQSLPQLLPKGELRKHKLQDIKYQGTKQEWEAGVVVGDHNDEWLNSVVFSDT